MTFNDNRPIYLQIADVIMDRIQQGVQSPGSRLPSVREYAGEAGVNPNTVMRTYTWLQNEGLISMKRGIGYFVEPGAPEKIRDVRYRDFFNNDFQQFLDKLVQFEVSPDRLKEEYINYINAHN